MPMGPRPSLSPSLCSKATATKVHSWVEQGIFLKRQKEVAVEMAAMSKDYYLRPEYMWEEILYGSKSAKFFELFDSVTSR